eukprot:COSAG04_NODE_1938_length_5175_cov_178.678093_5_plen_124_part_00
MRTSLSTGGVPPLPHRCRSGVRPWAPRRCTLNQLAVCSSQDNYEVIRKVGRGKYSEVFEGVHTGKEERCVVKVRPRRPFVAESTFSRSLLAGTDPQACEEEEDQARDQDSAEPLRRAEHHQPA